MSDDDSDSLSTVPLGGGKKSNGHKMECKCPICKNMMYKDLKKKNKSKKNSSKKSNGHKMDCKCPICKNMKKKGGQVTPPPPSNKSEDDDKSVSDTVSDSDKSDSDKFDSDANPDVNTGFGVYDNPNTELLNDVKTSSGKPKIDPDFMQKIDTKATINANKQSERGGRRRTKKARKSKKSRKTKKSRKSRKSKK